MNDLASVYIEVPIDLVDDWENYFWYATGPSASKLPVFKLTIGDNKFIYEGQWVEQGEALKVIEGYGINVRSPITGFVRKTYSKGIIIQPKKNFVFPEKAGEIMFREVVNFGHRIEREVEEYKTKSSFGRLLFDLRNGGSPWSDVVSRRKSPIDLLKELDKLLDAKCKIITEIN